MLPILCRDIAQGGGLPVVIANGFYNSHRLLKFSARRIEDCYPRQGVLVVCATCEEGGIAQRVTFVSFPLLSLRLA
jgi:hypothetical protein